MDQFELNFFEEIKDASSLLHKELYVLEAQASLLTQRLTLMRDFLHRLPATDFAIPTLMTQIEMDEIELSEVKIRSKIILDKLTGLS